VVQTEGVNAWPPPRACLGWEPVLKLEAPDATRAICRDPDGSLWLVHDLDGLEPDGDWDPEDWEEDFDWREEFGEPIIENGVAGLRTAINGIGAIGGRVPDGVSSVEVRDEARQFATATGEGLWLAAVDDADRQDPFIVFRRDDGSVVPVPAASELAEEGPLDSDTACPACGGQAWSVWSGEDDRVARCERCGLQVDLPEAGPVHHIVFTRDPANERSFEEVVRENWAKIVTGLGRPPFGLDDSWTRERRIAGWGGGGGPDAPVQSVTLDHGDRSLGRPGPWVSVTTGIQQFDEFFTVEEWIADVLAGEQGNARADDGGLEHDDASEPTERLAERRDHATAHAMKRFELVVAIDGAAEQFTAIGDDELWCACGEHEGFTITIAARGVPPAGVRLATAVVDDHLEPPQPPSAGAIPSFE